MSLFGLAKSVIFLRRQSLEYLTSKTSLHLDFPSETITNLEIQDKTKLSESLTKFLSENSLKKQSVLIILSTEVFFEKRFPESENLKSEIDNFYSEIPFDPNKLAKKEIRVANETVAFATNHEIFSTPKDVLSEAGSKVWAVVPQTVLPELENAQNLTPVNIPKILLQEKLINSANFLEVTTFEKKVSPKKKILIVTLLFAMISTLMLFGLFQTTRPTKNIKLPAVTSKKVSSPSDKITTRESTPSAKIKKKDEITIQVLNGTGTPGEAGLVQTQLQELGYQSLSTGNTLKISTDSASTTVFSTLISLDFRNEITTMLKKLFASVEEKAATPGAQFDVVITTSKRSASSLQ